MVLTMQILTKLNSQRVWVDEGNPQFGEGPNLN